MYEYSRRPSKFKNFILIFLLMVVVSMASIFIYSMYTKIEIQNFSVSPEATAERLYNDTKEGESKRDVNLEDISKSYGRVVELDGKVVAYAMYAPTDVSFTRVINSFPKDGRVFLIACGTTIFIIVVG